MEHLLERIRLHPTDRLDELSIIRELAEVQPDEVYNLAAMSFVPASWDQPMLTGEFNAQGLTRVLEAIRQVNPKIRLHQASSAKSREDAEVPLFNHGSPKAWVRPPELAFEYANRDWQKHSERIRSSCAGGGGAP